MGHEQYIMQREVKERKMIMYMQEDQKTKNQKIKTKNSD
jgi:hypothetical protein